MASSRGLPSTGCNKCRSRKIKCDETKPICERCTYIGNTECVYRDQFERTWKNQTEFAEERAKKKWRSRSRKSLEDQLQELRVAGNDSNTSGSQSEPSTVSPESPGVTVEEEVMERFFFDWVIDEQFEDEKGVEGAVPRRSVAFLPFLPVMFRAALAKPNLVLVESVTALSFANYGHRLKHSEASTRAIESYSAALKLLKQVILNPAAARKDEALVSVVLLGMYETLTSSSFTANGSWTAHLNGAITLLHARYSHDSNPRIVAGLCGMLFTQMLNNSIIRAQKPALPLNFRDVFSAPGSSYYNLWEKVHKTAELLSRLKDALRDFDPASPNSIDRVLDILNNAAPLDRSLEEWARVMPSDSSYKVVPIHKDTQSEWLWRLLESSWRPRAAHSYPTLLAETKWRFHWTTRLVLNQAILQSTKLLELAGLELTKLNESLLRRRETEFNILGLIDQLCESCLSPFTTQLLSKPNADSIKDFCTARGYMLLSPLLVVKLCLDQAPIQDFDLRGRKEWVQEVLWLLEREVGLAKAGAILPAPQNDKIAVQLWALSEND